jgi:hypothetical protein
MRDLLTVALRVLSCFSSLPHTQPAEADVELLRASVSDAERNWSADELARCVIGREVDRMRARRASGTTGGAS